MPPLIWRQYRSLRNSARVAAASQPLRAAAVAAVICTAWVIIGGVVLGLSDLLNRPLYLPLKARLLEVLLALFLFTVQALVVMSDLVLTWSALFRTRAAWFQAALPATDRSIFWSAAVEGGAWSSWAAMVLIVPLVAALAVEAAAPALWLLLAPAAVIACLLCCIAAGSLGALLLAGLLPLLRRFATALFVAGGAAVAGGALYALGWFEERTSPIGFMGDVVGRLAFAESPWLPSGWTAQALVAALGGRWAESLRLIALTAATAAALFVVAEWWAAQRLRRQFDRLAGRDERSRGGAGRSRAWRLPPLLPADLGLLVAKDLRVFLRDPAQIVQVTMFFGLLGFYLLMLPRLGAAFAFEPRWKLAVSVLNLVAIGMALATFTGRFVYPMLSLEGRRLWVLCLAPWPRSRIVTAKLAFALLVGLPLSVGLTVLSGRMLDLGWGQVAMQALVMACLCVGLAAAALGLGARHADYREDNPAKLVTGYGGTINLIASLAFTAVLVVPAGATLIPGAPGWVAPAALAWIAACTALWSRWHLGRAWRAFAEAG